MKRHLSRSCLCLSLIAALATAPVAFAQTNTPQADRAAPAPHTQTDAPDAMFVEAASGAGLAEVNLGKLGADKGQSPAVKTFGQQMVTDHTAANEELKSIASGKGIPVSQLPPASDTKAAAMLGNKSGTEFDTGFAKRMVADHKKVIALFTKESKSGKDLELKAFATKMLPSLQQHLQMAQQLPQGSGTGSGM